MWYIGTNLKQLCIAYASSVFNAESDTRQSPTAIKMKLILLLVASLTLAVSLVNGGKPSIDTYMPGCETSVELIQISMQQARDYQERIIIYQYMWIMHTSIDS